MTDSPLEAKLTKKVVDNLNRILELELAGVVRYMHYSFMIFGHNRIPIVAGLHLLPLGRDVATGPVRIEAAAEGEAIHKVSFFLDGKALLIGIGDVAVSSGSACASAAATPSHVLSAILAGEHITAFGGHPSLKIGSLLETHKHDVNEILVEAHEHEKEGLDAYYQLLELVEGKSILLEEYARDQIAAEEMHLADIRKMMRKPGSIR